MNEQQITRKDTKNTLFYDPIGNIYFLSDLDSIKMIIESHELTVRRMNEASRIMNILKIERSRLELKKPFIIQYYESFGRGF